MTSSSEKLEFPPVEPALVDALERAFPDRCPEPHLSDGEIRQRMGEVRVVRFLRAIEMRQSKTLYGASSAGGIG